PYVGRISVLRVLAGTLVPDDEVVVARTGATVRPHQLVRLCGRQQTPVDGPVPAGAVVAVAKLGDVSTGDVLAAPGVTVDLEVPVSPVGHHRVVLEPRSTSDDAKLSAALDRLRQEDPSARLHVDLATGA